MALRAIRLNRDPVLYRKCLEVEQVDDKVRQLLDDMLQTLHATSNGAAIAAPQVGVLRRLVVIDMGELSGRCAQIGQSQNHPQAGQTGVRRGLPEFSRPMGADGPTLSGDGAGIG